MDLLALRKFRLGRKKEKHSWQSAHHCRLPVDAAVPLQPPPRTPWPFSSRRHGFIHAKSPSRASGSSDHPDIG